MSDFLSKLSIGMLSIPLVMGIFFSVSLMWHAWKIRKTAHEYPDPKARIRAVYFTIALLFLVLVVCLVGLYFIRQR